MSKHKDLLIENPEASREQRELWRELDRMGIENDPCPTGCKTCGAELHESSGFANETILYCKEHGIQWEDSEGAISNVL